MLDDRYNENRAQKTIKYIAVSFLKLISFLPFWILYGLSDIMYILLRYLIKYRKKVIVGNLKNSFPEKSEKEIEQITSKFYRHFCDLIVETLKAYSMSEKQFEKRIIFKDVEQIDEYYDKGMSMIQMAMHYNNWEWSCSFQRKGKHQNLIVFNPIRGNIAFEKLMTKLRSRWGVKLIPVHQSARLTVNFHKLDKPSILWLIADQTPPPTTKFWTIFLNQETPFFNGPEKIASRSNQPVFMHHTKKIKRGYYEVYFYKLFENPAKVGENDVMLAYSQKLEEIIKEAPEYYLWSHRRWKHKKPENISLIE